jgi:hypothetical protein
VVGDCRRWTRLDRTRQGSLFVREERPLVSYADVV